MSNPGSSGPIRRSKVRFAVGRPEGPRSAVWRLWTNQSDVYVSSRNVAVARKVSLHASGLWRAAYHGPGLVFVDPGQDRAFDKWERPPEAVPGLTVALLIRVPASEVMMPPHPEDMLDLRRVKIEWVPPAPEGHLTQFMVVFTTAQATAATLPNWPGSFNMGTRLIFRADLPNTETVWVVAQDQPVPEKMRREIEESRRKMIGHLKHFMGEDRYYALPEPRGENYGRSPERGWRFLLDYSTAEEEG